MKIIREHRIFFGLFLLVSVLRFLPLFHYQFTLDELSGLCRTEFSSFSELIEKGVKIDAHPALIQILLFYLVNLFGSVTWVIKFPFLIFSLLTLVYAYFFACRNFSRQVALFSVAVFSFSLVFVFYAPIARMYISGVFFSTALLFHFYEIIFRKNNSNWQFLFLGLFALLSALNQHINALFALSMCVSGLFFLNKNNRLKYWITCVITVLVYLPHLPVTLYQLGVGGIDLEQGGWLEKPDWSVLFDFLKILFGTGYTYLVLLLAIVFKNIFDKTTRLEKKHLFLLLIFLFNFLVVYVYSLTRASVYQHSVMLFSGTTMVFFACSLLDFTRPFIFRTVLVLVCSSLLYKTYVIKDFFHQSIETVFEYQFQRTAHYKKLYGESKLFAVFLDADAYMKKIYFRKYVTSFNCLLSSDSACTDFKKFTALLPEVKADYFILSSATPQHDLAVRDYFPYLIESNISQANNFRVYSRVPEDSSRAVKGEKELFSSSVKKPNTLHYTFHMPGYFPERGLEMRVDSVTEFPLDVKCSYRKVLKKEGEVAVLRVYCLSANKFLNSAEVCVSVNDSLNGKNLLYNAGSVYKLRKPEDTGSIMYTQLFAGSKHEKISQQASVLSFYIWNKAKENFVIKDVDIKVIDYWPQKWNFWK